MTTLWKFNSKNNLSLLVVVTLILVLGTLKFTFQQANILSFDFFGLYLYLPATFIYHDPAISDLSWLQQINATYNNSPTLYQLQNVDSYHIIRFFCGMSILLSPFFFLGHGLALMSNYAPDGFSYPYQLAMMIGAFFYVALGLIVLRKVLLRFFNDELVAIILLALYLGTNLFFWTTFDAGAPHTILFTLFALLLWFTIKWHETPQKKYAIAIGFLIGLIVVSRPSGIVTVFIPLLWNVYDWKSLKTKWQLIVKNYSHFLLLILFTLIAGLPQIVYFLKYTGSVYYSTYSDPQSGLNLANPRFAWVLFSYRKGWLIYAPLMTFSLIGFILMFKKNRSVFYAILVYFILNLYLVASFTSLISYGWRAFIQGYAMLAIPLGYFIAHILERKNSLLKLFAGTLLLFFIALSVLQSWQIMKGIIDGSRMTKAYYFNIFGKTDVLDVDSRLLLIDRYMDDFNGHKMPIINKYWEHTLRETNFETPIEYHERFMISDPVDSTNTVFRIDTEMPYTPGVKVPNGQISHADYYWTKVKFKYLFEKPVNDRDLLLVITNTYQGEKEIFKGSMFKYRSYPVPNSELNVWHEFEIDYLSPEGISPQDRLETYVWYRGDGQVLIDDFSVKIYEPVSY